MPYVGTWALSSVMTVYLQTQSPNTASAVDADVLPSYRVYGNVNATPLTSGVFAALDSANTDGYYAVQVALSVTDGFSASGTYCVRKVALVCAVLAAQLDIFRIYLSS